MTLQAIRALFESHLNDAFQAMTPPVPVVFDNVQEEPPGYEHVILSLGYPSFTEPIVCQAEKMIEVIRGTIQVACYTPRAQGMLRIEEMATVAMQALNSIHNNPLAATVRPQMNQIIGPTPVLNGDQPYALVNLSAGFMARVGAGPTPPPPLQVDSLHGRVGDVVAEKGDYTIDEMSDVNTARPAAPGEFLDWNGTNWKPTPSVDSEDF